MVSTAALDSERQYLRVVDGRLVTGQNPASSTGTARAVLELLAVQKAA